MEAMESWLEHRLVNRTTRHVSLTMVGERCLDEVSRWVESADNMIIQLTPQGDLEGQVRIASSMSFGHARLMDAITRFMSMHPKVAVDIDLGDATLDLTRHQIDLAIRITASPNTSLTGKPIAKCLSVMVATEHYLKQAQPLRKPEDLINHECLSHNNVGNRVWNLRKGKTLLPVNVKCRLTANEATALLQATLHDAGIALLPTYLANPHINTGNLVRLLPDWEPEQMLIYALYTSRKHQQPIIRALIDYLSEYFARHSWD